MFIKWLAKLKQVLGVAQVYLLLGCCSVLLAFDASARPCDNTQLEFAPLELPAEPLSSDELGIVVWNAYKGQRDNWHNELSELVAGNQILMLQEGSRKQLYGWGQIGQWYRYQALAFEWLGDGLGVATLTRAPAERVCARLTTEPLIRFPKSSLSLIYRWQGAEVLIVNVHSVNFTLDELTFTQQLADLSDELNQHTGPVVLAGDFNTWSDSRLAVFERFIQRHGLQLVAFEPDLRSRVFGEVLDHVAYRGLSLVSAKSIVTDSSDHNALLIRFRR